MDTTQSSIQNDIQDKVKIKVLGTPMNMQGEVVFDFRNASSIVVSLYPKYRTVDISEYINSVNGYQVKGIQVIGEQQPSIVGVSATGGDSDGTARAKINEIILLLRAHGLIAMP